MGHLCHITDIASLTGLGYYQGLMMARFFAAVMAALLPAGLAAEEKPLPTYKPGMRVNGPLTTVGSDTLNNLMVFWGEEFNKLHPKCRIQIEGKGSSTALSALSRGVSDMGPMSRLPKPKELEMFASARPDDVLLMFTVAMDAMCIVVRKDCPVEQLSLKQVDAMFSTTLNRGAEQPVTQWSQLGVKGDLAEHKIRLLGRNSASASYGYFQKAVLLKGDYRKDIQECRGSAHMVAALKPGHVGYVGFGYVTPNAKSLKIKDEGEYVAPTFDTIRGGSYPISRQLYIAVPAHKEKGIKPEVQEFLSYVLSRAGQEVVKKDGYVPLGLQQCRDGYRLLDAKDANILE